MPNPNRHSVRSSLGCASLRAARPLANLCIAFATAVALVLAAASADAQTGARLLRIAGSVEVATGEPPSWRPAQPGQVLTPGAAIRTGDGARAEVALDSSTVRVYENSLLRIPAQRAPGAHRLWMGAGAGIFDVKLSAGDRFEVETPEAVAAVKGTRFHVRVERGRDSFGVYEGVVELRGAEADPSQEALLVREGFAARSERETFELVVLATEDPWDTWESGAPLSDSATTDVTGEVEPGGAQEQDESPANRADEDGVDTDPDPPDDGVELFEVHDDAFEVDGDPFEERGWEDAVESEDSRNADDRANPSPNQ